MNPVKIKDPLNETTVTSFWTMIYKLFMGVFSRDGITGLIALVSVGLVTWALVVTVLFIRDKAGEWSDARIQIEKDNAKTTAAMSQLLTDVAIVVHSNQKILSERTDMFAKIVDSMNSLDGEMKKANEVMGSSPARGEKTLAVLEAMLAVLQKNQPTPQP